MLLMVEKGIRGGMCQAIYKYAKANNKYMKNCDANQEASYLEYLDANNLYGWSMSKNFGKVEKLIQAIEDIKDYVIHISALKQALNHCLKLTKVYRVITFNQEAWLEPYIDKNTKLRKEAKNDFEKNVFKLMNNSVFRKTIENVRKHRDIKLKTTEKRRLKLVSEPNYQANKTLLRKFNSY